MFPTLQLALHSTHLRDLQHRGRTSNGTSQQALWRPSVTLFLFLLASLGPNPRTWSLGDLTFQADFTCFHWQGRHSAWPLPFSQRLGSAKKPTEANLSFLHQVPHLLSPTLKSSFPHDYFMLNSQAQYKLTLSNSGIMTGFSSALQSSVSRTTVVRHMLMINVLIFK